MSSSNLILFKARDPGHLQDQKISSRLTPESPQETQISWQMMRGVKQKCRYLDVIYTLYLEFRIYLDPYLEIIPFIYLP